MAVYTTVSQEDLRQFLGRYPLGRLLGHAGIAQGVVNTNYYVTTTEGEFVLTLFEHLAPGELPYFLELMAYLADHGLPSAHPIADNAGHYLAELNGKPAALVRRLEGRSMTSPGRAHCAAIGAAMARIHVLGAGFPRSRENRYGRAWWQGAATRLRGLLDARARALLEGEIAFQHRRAWSGLPSGVIHADLFRDNALFIGDRLTGIIDFYYACNDAFIYDLAVTINDWCRGPDARLDPDAARFLLDAYQEVRPISAPEIDCAPVALRAAALRWWVSRLLDRHFPRTGEMIHAKDPDAFRTILERARDESHDFAWRH
jgi:homoserine kinase type II